MPLVATSRRRGDSPSIAYARLHRRLDALHRLLPARLGYVTGMWKGRFHG